MIFKLSENQPIDTMKADYCVVVWAVNLSEQTLFGLPLRHFDLTNDLCPMVIICSALVAMLSMEFEYTCCKLQDIHKAVHQDL